MSNYRRGASFEREVATRFDREGFFVTRAAGSGTADRASADIVALYWDTIVIAECKTYSGDYEGHKVEFDGDQLDEIAARLGHDPVPSDMRDTYIGVAIKNSSGGIAQWTGTRDSPVVTVEETIPLYEFIEQIIEG